MKIKTKYNNNELFLNLSKLNIFYGCSNSGKSSFLSFIADCFSQKRKEYFEVDGSLLQKKDYEIIFVETGNSFNDQIKLSAKSILRKLILDYVETVLEEKVNDTIKNSLNEFVSTININLKEFENSINSECTKDKISIGFGDVSLESILPNLLSFSFSNESENCSSSVSKEHLYSLLFRYIEKYKRKTILFIDDFDINFDLETSISFINSLRNVVSNNDCYVLLSTNKATSLECMQNEDGIFHINKGKITKVNCLDKIIYDYMINQYASNSFREYAELGGMAIENQINKLYKIVYPNIENNIGRILTNNNCAIVMDYAKIDKNKVNVYAKCEEEYNFLCYFKTLFNDN